MSSFAWPLMALEKEEVATAEHFTRHAAFCKGWQLQLRAVHVNWACRMSLPCACWPGSSCWFKTRPGRRPLVLRIGIPKPEGPIPQAAHQPRCAKPPASAERLWKHMEPCQKKHTRSYQSRPSHRPSMAGGQLDGAGAVHLARSRDFTGFRLLSIHRDAGGRMGRTARCWDIRLYAGESIDHGAILTRFKHPQEHTCVILRLPS